MAAKSVTVTLQPGVYHATLPDHRKMKPGVNYVIDWETFKKISNGARQNVITVVSINTVGGDTNNVWMSSNANPNANPNTILQATSSTPTTTLLGGLGAQGMNSSLYQTAALGTVLDGTQDEKYMYVQVGDSNACSAGDVVVWLDEVNRYVTRTRPAVTYGKTTVGTFAGVCINTLSGLNYGWIQVIGEVDQVNTATNITAGQTLAVDPSNPGDAMAGVGEITLATGHSVYALNTTSATSGSFTLSVSGYTTTGAIAWNAATSVIQGDIDDGTHGPAGTTVTGTSPGAMVVTVPGDIVVTANFGSLVGGSPTITLTDSTQTVQLNSAIEGGTFTLTWNNLVTSPLPYDATAAQILTALEALTGFSGSTSGGPVNNSAVTITFTGTLNQITAYNLEELVTNVPLDGIIIPATFGTALTTSSSVVQGYIRSEKVKLPYHRAYNRN